MDKYTVQISSSTTESVDLVLNRYYINTDYKGKVEDVTVNTSYERIDFGNLSGDVLPDDCIDFSGTSNNTLPDGTVPSYSASIRDNQDWLRLYSASKEEVKEISGDASSGDVCSIFIKQNNTSATRTGYVDFIFQSKKATVTIVQTPNNEYVVYTLSTNALDGTQVSFNDNGQEKYTATTKNGTAVYIVRKINTSESGVTATITDGLPSEESSYSIISNNGQYSSILNSNGEKNWVPDLTAKKIKTVYTWSSDNTLQNSGSVNILPNDTGVINYHSYVEDDGNVKIKVSKNSYGRWITINDNFKNNIQTLNAAANTSLNDRSMPLIYHAYDDTTSSTITESGKAQLNYTVSQSKGTYQFQFNNTNPTFIDVKSVSSDGINASVQMAFNEAISAMPVSDIVSTVGNNTKVPFYALLDGVATSIITNVVVTSNNIRIFIKRNPYNKPRNATITFVQYYTGKRIYLTIKQQPVQAHEGDVYCYDQSENIYSYVDVLGNDSIPYGSMPIGVVVLTQNNQAPSFPDYARIVALIEKDNDDYNDKTWRKADGSDFTQEPERPKTRCLETNDPVNWCYIGSDEQGYYYTTHNNNSTVYFLDGAERHSYVPCLVNPTGNSLVNINDTCKDIPNGKPNAMGDYSGLTRTIVQYQTNMTGPNNRIARMAHNYTTQGTKAGDWYLGGAGEMACLCQKACRIHRVFLKLQSLGYRVDDFFNYGSTKTNSERPEMGYWTSTYSHKDEEYYSWYVNLTDGCFDKSIHRRSTNESHKHNHAHAHVRLMLMAKTDKDGNEWHDGKQH